MDKVYQGLANCRYQYEQKYVPLSMFDHQN